RVAAGDGAARRQGGLADRRTAGPVLRANGAEQGHRDRPGHRPGGLRHAPTSDGGATQRARGAPVNEAHKAEIGVFGGSGFYTFLSDVETVTVDTAWGSPSGPVTIGSIDDVRVAFLPRHGPHHEWPPHRVNYRANVDAMRQLGVHTLLAPFAAGSLR